jgi:GH25 family lysozyme M1 (1,4-beta-N-acetylmuramidase)
MIVGNDISGHQGQIDYGVYKNNTNFLIAKSSEGVGFIDPWYGYNRSQARLAGIPFGSYHFCRPDLGNSPEAEAKFFCDLIDGDPIREGETLYLDYECANQKQSDVDWCKKWLDYVSNHFKGLKPMIYLNQSQVKAFNWKSVIDAGYALWLASYQAQGVGDTGQWPSMAMQQWTSSQKVPGITGNLDGDYFFGTTTQFKAYGYKKPVIVPPTPPVPPVVTDSCQVYKNKLKQINTIVSKSYWFYKSTFKQIKDLSA